MDSKLLEIPRDQWTILRDVYAGDRTNLTGYDLIEYFLNWTPSSSDETINIYTTDIEFADHGRYILIHSVAQKAYVYLNTVKGSLEELQSALCTLNLQTWHLICGYDERLKPVVEYYWSARGQPCKLVHQETLVYHLPKSTIKKFPQTDTPQFQCRKLEPVDSRVVDRHWPYRSAESLLLITGLIRNNISAGFFETGTLHGWCLRSPHGSLSNLHVLAAYRRSGVGSKIIRYMAELIEAKGSEVLATVVPENEKSRKMFEKLGFEVINKLYWSAVPETLKQANE
ncbi:uncharacterized protein LOC111069144 [Drosophila obscura]|uniref:uncharacterized protein LOC111069144 n=1 Tax=Drosophila obscura TaxID=7282 RepID=UPI001BB2BBE1|nr:uncharacterized protein LOC111069144 [Drosophila obscura]